MKEFMEMVEKIIGLIKENFGLDKAPWWAKMIILPIMLVVGAIYTFNDELGKKMIEGLFAHLERWRKTFMKVGEKVNAPEAVGAVFDKFGDLFGQAKDAALNYFGDKNRKRRWRWRIWIAVGLMALLLGAGLIFHHTTIGIIFLSAFALLFCLPLFALSGILMSIKLTNKLGLVIIRSLAILLLLVAGAVVVSNAAIYLAVLSLTIFTLLFGYAWGGKSKGLLPTVRVLAFFVAFCFLGRVVDMSCHLYKPAENTFNGANKWLSGKTELLLAAVGLTKAEDDDAAKYRQVLTAAEKERPRRQVIEPANLWAILEKGKQPSINIQTLLPGQLVTAYLKKQQEDDLEEQYTYVVLLPDTSNDRVAGWVQSRLLADIANEVVMTSFTRPRQATVQAALFKPTPTLSQTSSANLRGENLSLGNCTINQKNTTSYEVTVPAGPYILNSTGIQVKVGARVSLKTRSLNINGARGRCDGANQLIESPLGWDYYPSFLRGRELANPEANFMAIIGHLMAPSGEILATFSLQEDVIIPMDGVLVFGPNEPFRGLDRQSASDNLGNWIVDINLHNTP